MSNKTKYGQTSLARLATAHPDLRRVFMVVGELWDCSILCGHRGKAEQEAAHRSGGSKAKWGESPHNAYPALAVDAWPYPIDWVDLDRARMFAGYVLGVGRANGVPIEWGGDWHGELFDRNSGDRPLHEEVGLDDLPHFQLANWRELLP